MRVIALVLIASVPAAPRVASLPQAAPAMVLTQAPTVAHDAGPDDAPDHLPQWVEAALHRYGPATVLVVFAASAIGVHVNEDMLLIPAGFLAAGNSDEGVRLFWQFAFFAYVGIVLGDSGWFWICRTFGTRLLHRRWFKRLMHPRRMLEVKHQIDVRGALVLLAARFVPGTRIPAITMCGMMHMAWWKFLAVEMSCVIVTVTFQLSIGWFAAKAASSAGVTKLSHQLAIGVGVTVAVIVMMYLLSIWLRARAARTRTPRARARWLRLYIPRLPMTTP